MKRILLTIGALTVLGLLSVPASAGDNYYRAVRHNNHVRHHDELGHRSFHRELAHNDAHRFPMSYRSHGRLHDNLNHEAFHDSLGHGSAHRTRAYTPRYITPSFSYGHGSGIGFRSRGVSLFLGF